MSSRRGLCLTRNSFFFYFFTCWVFFHFAVWRRRHSWDAETDVLFVGVLTVPFENVREGTLEETIIKNQSILLVDTPENFFQHLEMKASSVFAFAELERAILLVRNPADTLLEDFLLRNMGPIVEKTDQGSYKPSKGTISILCCCWIIQFNLPRVFHWCERQKTHESILPEWIPATKK